MSLIDVTIYKWCLQTLVILLFYILSTASKVSKYGVICGPNTGKYGPEITPYLDTL